MVVVASPGKKEKPGRSFARRGVMAGGERRRRRRRRKKGRRKRKKKMVLLREASLEKKHLSLSPPFHPCVANINSGNRRRRRRRVQQSLDGVWLHKRREKLKEFPTAERSKDQPEVSLAFFF